MAKRGNEQTPPRSNSNLRVRWVEVELNGSDATIEEALRTVERMRRPVIEPPPMPKRIVSTTTPANGENAAPQDPTLFDSEGQGQTEGGGAEPTPDSNGDNRAGTEAQRKKRGEGVNRDRNAGLAIVKSLNLQPDGKESLKGFVAQKKPKTQEEHIAVYLYYLTKVLEAEKVGFSHIYTCFKETGERMPGDLPQTCRNAASKKGWIDTSDADDLKGTTRGDNLVEKDLPRAPDSAGEGTK
ncbi:MAG TPA: hypothetical protein VHX86_13895 [Tepidisphaeraceae bacterium]|jgi:ABC-type Fe3+-hydroxamate transport system substrate-binding protein|nr:hypothetical protein [Tepidisphaeraceae bacterium]